MSKLSEKLSKGDFVITSEIGPPKGTNVDKCLDEAEHIKDRVTAINVTDIQSAVMRFGSMATCHLLLDRGIEPVFQMVCRDRNRLALQSDLLSVYGLGVENVLCLTGDHNTLGDDPDSMPVFDLDSVSLLHAATTLQQGRDLVGNELEGTPKFFLGAVVTPDADPLEPQIIKMEKKIAAGAQFFQTQAVYDLKAFENFMKQVEPFGVPILAGIILLKSAGMARFMNKNIAGVFVPDELIREMAKTKNRVKTSVDIAARLIKGLKGLCRGVHIMPLGWEKQVPAVLDAAEL